MIRRFVTCDADGRLTGSFADDGGAPPPAGAFEVPEDVWSEWLLNPMNRAWADGTLVEVEAPGSDVPSVPAMDAADWRDRFSDEEKGAVTLAASRALEAGDPRLQVFLDDLAIRRVVHLDNPRMVAGVAALADAGLISAERGVELLTP